MWLRAANSLLDQIGSSAPLPQARGR